MKISKEVLKELKHHMPFTLFGAASGILLIIFFNKIPSNLSYNLFYTLHPIHVLLSALVTASMYKAHKCNKSKDKCNIWILLVIGYLGSVGIATISDSLIPYLGEVLLKLPNKGIHIGFIEEWAIVNPLAMLGIAIAYFWPTTKFPHFGHVMFSTWASLFHIIMAIDGTISWTTQVVIFIFLFFAVWIPCCISDIVFPLLFTGKKK